MELNDQHRGNIDFIKNYDPQQGISVSSGKLVTSGKNTRVTGISDEVLKSIDESLNYNKDLSNKIISLLARGDNSSASNTHDKVQNLLQLIDHSKQIKNGLDNLISSTERSGHSTEEVERLKAIVSVHIEQLSKLLDKEPTLLKISSRRNDAPLDVAINTLVKPPVQSDYKKEFLEALEHKNEKKIADLISKGADINMRLPDGSTPLTFAVVEDLDNIVQILLSAGADPNLPDDFGNYPFLDAIDHKKMVLVNKFLMDPNLDVNVKTPKGDTALILASSKGKDLLVNVLLRRGVNINERNNDGHTPVFIAALRGQEDIVRLLIQEGADVTLACNTGATPLNIAVFQGDKEIVQIILDEGINPDVGTDPDGNTALHIAAEKGFVQIVRALIRAGADPLKENNGGYTPLDVAALSSRGGVCDIMLDAIDLKALSELQRQELAFGLASGGLDDQLEKLIAVHPDVVNMIEEGQSLLMTAIAHEQRAVISLLLEKGAKTSGVYDKYGHDPLMQAAFIGAPYLLKELLKHGADASYRDPNGFTALEYFMVVHYDNLMSVNKIFPSSAIDQTLEHFGMQNLPRNSDTFADVVEKLDLAKRANLHKRFDLPIEDTVKIYSDGLYAKLKNSRYDVDQLRQSNIQAHSKLQAARMSGSTTIRYENSYQKSAATDDWAKADDLVRSWVNNNEPLTLENLCKLNSILNPKNRKGEFRHPGAMTAGGNLMKSYVQYSQVRKEMARFMPWLEGRLAACDTGNENPIIVAAQAYQQLVSIHPFSDANGRTCRLVMDYVLQRYGLPPSSPSDVNVAVFALFQSDITPSSAVMTVASGLEYSSNYFKEQV